MDDGVGVQLSEFLKELMSYQKAARDRFPQYLNTHFSDATFEQRTLYEMLMSMSGRLAKIEEVMKPADEHVKDEEADALEHKSPRLY
jgi:hypothetical protein